MDTSTTLYIKMDQDKQIRIDLSHITEALPTPNEQDRERGLTVREIEHVSKRLAAKDFSTASHF